MALKFNLRSCLTCFELQGVAIWQLFTGATVLSPLCISMLWAIYNAIPPYLILHFAIFGRVSLFRHLLWCAVCAFALAITAQSALR